MSFNPNPSNSLEPLSIGNVVSAGVRLYRSHFKQFLGLSLQGFLWFFVPIYGWAKAHTLNAIIARLTFAELINQPESETACRTELNPRLWNFFVTQILVGLTLFGVDFGISIIENIITVGASMAIGRESVISAFVSLLVQLVGFVVYLWFYARIFVPELTVAVENILDGGQAIARSWELTKGYAWRLQAIIFVASLITMPLIAIAGIPFIIGIVSIITTFATNIDNLNNPAAWSPILISMGLGVILMLFASALINPFWQAIKAVIYYDLRTRQEGLGLKLRDREI